MDSQTVCLNNLFPWINPFLNTLRDMRKQTRQFEHKMPNSDYKTLTGNIYLQCKHIGQDTFYLLLLLRQVRLSSKTKRWWYQNRNRLWCNLSLFLIIITYLKLPHWLIIARQRVGKHFILNKVSVTSLPLILNDHSLNRPHC